jgi:starch synthase
MEPVTEKRNILMVAAENGALAGGKVGGLGDVIREAPPVLARSGCAVSVVTPSYGFLHHGSSSAPGALEFEFGGERHQAAVHRVQGSPPAAGVTHFVVDHPLFESRDPATGRHRIYTPDPSDAPFASDATKFALFGTAVAEAVTQGVFGRLTCLHLHDWHAAFVLLLRRWDERYRKLGPLRAAFTIHNLALQGVRPLQGHPSSFKSWFPRLMPDWREVTDPRWPVCINPMAAAIRLADSVHTVSPSYAAEILKPSDPPRYFGGEGLEADLRLAEAQGRLHGILNGCATPPGRVAPRREVPELAAFLQSQVIRWAGARDSVPSVHFIAHARLAALAAGAARPEMVLTAVSRAVAQKLLILRSAGTRCPSGLEGVLAALGSRGVLILLGAGDPEYERFLVETSARFDNFVFLNGYSDACAETLYASGDLFLMPSSFEPCGIGQMLAMRDGQPCLAHRIGGLKDTVTDAVNGFTFEGDSVPAQVDAMIQTLGRAIDLKRNDPAAWEKIRRNAASAAFDWDGSARRYIAQLYT